MITEKQIEANRRNAQLSTGPVTAEGTSRSSLNARRRSLTGQVSTMTGEDRIAHDEFSAAMLKNLAPEGAGETQFAQRIARAQRPPLGRRVLRDSTTDSGRLNRISAVEDNIFALGFHDYGGEIDTEHPEIHAALTAAKTFQAQAKQIQLLSLYEQRLNRAVRNLAILQNLQARRKAERRRALDEAKKLYQVNDRKGLGADLTSNGFVFSNDEIREAIGRDRRLRQAEHRHFRNHKHKNLEAKAA